MADEPKFTTVQHFDAGVVVNKGSITPEGWLRANATLSRTGIQKYQRADGTTYSVLRLADEVFKKESMDSFSMVPVTDGHPNEILNAENTNRYQVGQIGENIERDGEMLRAKILITNAQTIKKILDGEKVQLSNGYLADECPESGIYKGEHYDSIQKNIRGNHVALVHIARGGPELRVRFDGLAQFPNAVVELPSITNEGITTLTKYNIDGVDFEVSESAAQAFDKKLEAINKTLATLTLDSATASAKADGLESELAQTKEMFKVATDPAKIQAVVSARVALESKAAKVLKDVQLNTMNDLDIKVAYVEKVRGSALTRKDPAYVDAAFDLAESAPGAIATAGTQVDASKVVTDDGKLDSKKAYQAFKTEMGKFIPPGKLQLK